LAEISRLQKELDQANESIDDKLDKLEEAGLGVVQLTKLLQDARARITGMEGEIAALRRKDAMRLRRMHKIRCAKCHSTMDVSALSRWLDQDDK
jgi:myosin protein heavy chain